MTTTTQSSVSFDGRYAKIGDRVTIEWPDPPRADGVEVYSGQRLSGVCVDFNGDGFPLFYVATRWALFCGVDAARNRRYDATVCEFVAGEHMYGRSWQFAEPPVKRVRSDLALLVDKVLNPPTMGVGGGSKTEESAQDRHKAECIEEIQRAQSTAQHPAEIELLRALQTCVSGSAGNTVALFRPLLDRLVATAQQVVLRDGSAAEALHNALCDVYEEHVGYREQWRKLKGEALGQANGAARSEYVQVQVVTGTPGVLGIVKGASVALGEDGHVYPAGKTPSICVEGKEDASCVAGAIDLCDLSRGLQSLAKTGAAFGDKKQAVAAALFEQIRQHVADDSISINNAASAFQAVCEGLAASPPVALEQVAEPVRLNIADVSTETLMVECKRRGVPTVEAATTKIKPVRCGEF